MTAYDDGLALGRSEKRQREAGFPADLRWDLAAAQRTLSGDEFAEFARGVRDGLAD